MDWEAIFFTGGAGQGQKSMGQGGEAPPPHSVGQGREGVKICGAGYWLKSYAAAKEISICIALSEVNLLNTHDLDRNHN